MHDISTTSYLNSLLIEWMDLLLRQHDRKAHIGLARIEVDYQIPGHFPHIEFISIKMHILIMHVASDRWLV